MRHFRAALAAAFLLAPSVASGQQATSVGAPAGMAPVQAPCVQQADKSCKPIGTDPTTGVVTPLPSAPVIAASTSTPAPFTTSTPVTVEFVPQLGRPVRLIARLTAGTSYSAQVFTSPDHCATLNPITVAGTPWAVFTGMTGTVNEDIDTPMLSGISYCATVTPGSGATLTGGLRQ